MTILIVTVLEKFAAGGWLTLVVTGVLVALCFAIKRHYGRVVDAIRRLDDELPDPLAEEDRDAPKPSVANLGRGRRTAVAIDRDAARRGALRRRLRRPRAPRAADAPPDVPGALQGRRLLLGRRHRLGQLQGHRRGARAREARRSRRSTSTSATRTWLGLPAESAFSTGIEVAVEAEKLATDLIQKYPKGLFVAGQLIFDEDTFATRILHNETAFIIQRRLQHAGVPMVVSRSA